MTQYDSIFLGSSPLMIICHNALNSKENSLLIEQNERIGGAWYTDELWNIKNLELGCHILKNYQAGHELMTKSNLKPIEMKIPPKKLFRTRKGESFLNTLKINFLLMSKAFQKRKLIEMYKVDKIGNLLKKKEIQKYFYFQDGCNELINDLANCDNNILTSKIAEVSVKDGKANLILEDGQEVSTAKLYVPKNYRIDRFEIEGEKIAYEYENYVSEHYVFLFENEIKDISFVDVVGDDLINLVSNVGLYTDTIGKGVLCVSIKKSNGVAENNLSVRTFEDMPTKEEQDSVIKLVLQKLKQFKIIDSSNQHLKSHYEPYILNVKTNKSQYDIGELSKGIIEELDTSDLILSMMSNSKLISHE